MLASKDAFGDLKSLPVEQRATVVSGADPEAIVESVELPAELLACPFVGPQGLQPGGEFLQHLNVKVPDSDARAIAHVAGTAPNRWGKMNDGTDLRDLLGLCKDGNVPPPNIPIP